MLSQKDEMLKIVNKSCYCNFSKEPSLILAWPKGRKNTNGVAGAVPGAEDNALGERPQNEITWLPVLCPELRMMRPWGALK